MSLSLSLSLSLPLFLLTVTQKETLTVPLLPALARVVSTGFSPLSQTFDSPPLPNSPCSPCPYEGASAWGEAALLQTLVPWITARTRGASVHSGAACLDDNVRGHEGAILNGGPDKTGAKEPKLWAFPEWGQQWERPVCVCVWVCVNVFVVVERGDVGHTILSFGCYNVT